MKPDIYRSVMCLLLLFLFSCSLAGQDSEGRSIVGTWTGDTPLGKMTFVVDNENTLRWLREDASPVSASYHVDYLTTPMQLDLFDADDIKLQQMVFRGIFKFEDNDTVLIFGFPNIKGASENRPDSFGEHTARFTRTSQQRLD